MNVFFSCQFANYPLVWMILNPTLNNRINKLQERALRLVHNDNTSSFYELFKKTIPLRNIQKLALKMYRVKLGIAPKIMCELCNGCVILCVRQSDAAPFCENYAKLYFDAKHLKKGLNRG